jgi:hypothetical protein
MSTDELKVGTYEHHLYSQHEEGKGLARSAIVGLIRSSHP